MEFHVLTEDQFRQITSGLEVIRQGIEDLKKGEAFKGVICSDELCRMLGVSKKTLQNYRNAKAISFIQYSGKIWYRRSDVEAFLNKHHIKY